MQYEFVPSNILKKKTRGGSLEAAAATTVLLLLLLVVAFTVGAALIKVTFVSSIWHPSSSTLLCSGVPQKKVCYFEFPA